MKIWIIILLSALTTISGAGAYAYYLGKDLKNISFENHNGKPIPGIGGFDIPINVLVANPSKITIPIKYIEYEGVLEATGETLTKGKIENIKITKLSNTWINTTAHANWDKSASATVELLKQDNVWINVNLKINMFNLVSIPHSTKIDIKDALKGQSLPITIKDVPFDKRSEVNEIVDII